MSEVCSGTATAAYCIPHCRFGFITLSTVSFKSRVSVWRGGLIDVWVVQRWTTAFILGPRRVGLFLTSYYWQTPEAGSSGRPGNGTWHQMERCSSLSCSEFRLTVRKEGSACWNVTQLDLLIVFGWRKAGWQTRARWISICWYLLWFQWIFFLNQDFISPQCYQKLQTLYIFSPECFVSYFCQILTMLNCFSTLQSDTLPYEEH